MPEEKKIYLFGAIKTITICWLLFVIGWAYFYYTDDNPPLGGFLSNALEFAGFLGVIYLSLSVLLLILKAFQIWLSIERHRDGGR